MPRIINITIFLFLNILFGVYSGAYSDFDNTNVLDPLSTPEQVSVYSSNDEMLIGNSC